MTRFGTILILTLACPTYATVCESFEDGDYTSNPAWTLHIDQGASEIGPDPIRPDNLVYKVHGTGGGNRSVFTQPGDSLAWTGLNISLDFLATDWGFHPQWTVATPNLEYDLGFGLWLDPSWSVIRLYPSERQTRLMQLAVDIQLADFSLNTWYRIHTFHDPQAGHVRTEVRLLETNELLAAVTFVPTENLAQLPAIDTLWLGAEEVQWQFFDNIVLFSAASRDCNENGLPDECDIAAGTSPDCNQDGLADDCVVCDLPEDCNDCVDTTTDGCFRNRCIHFSVCGLNIVPGDMDGDGDLDLDDFAIIQLCFGGPDQPTAPSCPFMIEANQE